jgi:hypothetical protein
MSADHELVHKRSAPPPWMVPISHEVAEYCVENRCPGAQIALGSCPCGITTVLVCTGCGIPVLYLTTKGKWCLHAERLRQESALRWQLP